MEGLVYNMSLGPAELCDVMECNGLATCLFVFNVNSQPTLSRPITSCLSIE